MPPAFGFYGDDFTGASAHLDEFRMAGLRTLLFLRTPDADLLRRHAQGLDAVGIAGIARALPPEAMAEEVLPALRALQALGCRQVQYKICSTFDSTPRRGSIGRALELARTVFGGATVPIVPACPAAGRWTVFGNHFANGGERLYRLDRHPTMAVHPATPMTESDLCRVLGDQTKLPVGLLDIRAVKGPDLERAWIAATGATASAAIGPAAMVLDALDRTDLDRIAAFILARRMPFVIAAQELAGALGRAVAPVVGSCAGPSASLPPVRPLLVLSGSGSLRTEQQIAAAEAAGWPAVRLDVAALLHGDPAGTAATLADALAAQLGTAAGAVAYTARGPADPAIAVATATAAQLGLGPEAVAARIGTVFGAVITLLARRCGLRRVVLAGGDTSSAALRGMDADALRILGNSREAGGRISELLSSQKLLHGLQLLLKAGQTGSEDVFLRAVAPQGWT